MRLNLPNRSKRPRKTGITSIHDVGITIAQQKGILENYSSFLDIAKIGVGCAYILPNLIEKINLYQEYKVKVYFGGTLFEKAYSQNKIDEYLSYCDKNEIDTIEVSTGTIDIDLQERINLVTKISKTHNTYAEVGSKDTEKVMAPSSWIQEIEVLLNAGAKYVITEGRDSGTAGIFRPSGEMRTGLIDDIAKSCSSDQLIFEAPNSQAQMYFINLIGSNVNLGNINPFDLPLLEAQRCGLRSETFNLK